MACTLTRQWPSFVDFYEKPLTALRSEAIIWLVMRQIVMAPDLIAH
jgi:hypothetical protein